MILLGGGLYILFKRPFSPFLVNGFLMLSSVMITLAVAEISYRVYLYLGGAFQWQYQYRVASFVYGVYDKDFGVRYPPNKKFTLFTVKNGKVTWCPQATSISNEDGINGKTTIDKYNKANLKILVFGDSFTHWNQMGYTWPDLLERIFRS